MSTTTTYEAGTLYHVDPMEVVIDDNVREMGERQIEDVSTEFSDSVAEHGVLLPVLARVTEDGKLAVCDGQLRTLAARNAGLKSIPVYVGTEEQVEGTEAEQSRIITQLVTNDQRVELTQGERVNAWAQLSLTGLTSAQIAKQVGAPKPVIETGLKVSKSAAATTQLVQHETLTLEEAALWVEFEGNKDATEQLDYCLKHNRSALLLTAEVLRKEYARQKKRAEITRELEEANITVLITPNWDSPAVALEDLLTPDGKEITPETHAACSGHVAWFDRYEDNKVIYGCAQAKKYEHVAKHRQSMRGPATEEEKAEKRRVRANNRELEAANTLRRTFVTEALTQKTAPKGTAKFVATVMAEHHDVLSKNGGQVKALEFLGMKRPESLTKALERASDARAQVIAAGIAFGTIETSIGKDSWRDTYAQYIPLYLKVLVEQWGHSPSPIEKAMIEGTAAKNYTSES